MKNAYILIAFLSCLLTGCCTKVGCVYQELYFYMNLKYDVSDEYIISVVNKSNQNYDTLYYEYHIEKDTNVVYKLSYFVSSVLIQSKNQGL